MPVTLQHTTHATTPQLRDPQTPHLLIRALHLWHLLSLDAPTVATLWTALIAHAAAVRLPPATLPAMFLAVWLLYAADRLLDARSLDAHDAPQRNDLEPRHLFHHAHRRAFRVTLALVAAALAWLIPRLAPATLRLNLILGTLLLAYFVLIHTPLRAISPPRGRLPKEIAVGLFFAIAVFLPTVAAQLPSQPPPLPTWHSLQPHSATLDPTRSRLPASATHHPAQDRGPDLKFLFRRLCETKGGWGGVPAVAPVALLFAALCSLNCIAIYAWEHPHPNPSQPHHPLTRFGVKYLAPALLSVLAAALALALFSPFPSPLLALALAAALLLLLHRLHRRLNPLSLRALADLALATPLLFLLRP